MTASFLTCGMQLEGGHMKGAAPVAGDGREGRVLRGLTQLTLRSRTSGAYTKRWTRGFSRGEAAHAGDIPRLAHHTWMRGALREARRMSFSPLHERGRQPTQAKPGLPVTRKHGPSTVVGPGTAPQCLACLVAWLQRSRFFNKASLALPTFRWLNEPPRLELPLSVARRPTPRPDLRLPCQLLHRLP